MLLARLPLPPLLPAIELPPAVLLLEWLKLASISLLSGLLLLPPNEDTREVTDTCTRGSAVEGGEARSSEADRLDWVAGLRVL